MKAVLLSSTQNSFSPSRLPTLQLSQWTADAPPHAALQFQTCLDQFVSIFAVYSVLFDPLSLFYFAVLFILLFKPARNVL